MDWDNDGRLDILSGCYWTDGAPAGQIQILSGQGGMRFAAATSLLNADGKPLENSVLPGGNDDPNITNNICTQQHAVDYDGDGDLDLVVGSFGPHFFLYQNEGDAKQPKLSTSPTPLPIKLPDYHSAPHLVDLDGDGLLEFISGSSNGKVYISRNEGTRAEPRWSDFQVLLDIASEHEIFSTDEKVEPKPGNATRVWTTDWNGDGVLDLVVGDSITISSSAGVLSKEEFDAKKKEWDDAMQKISEVMTKDNLSQRYYEAIQSGKEVDKELEAAYMKVSQEINDLYESRSEWINERRTGHVWVYLQKAKAVGQPANVR
ncbi:MAG: VCBS repeat-containing protein [Planctomycetaceae bacterium]|nr:VCBS repeat-containing protein [Planctomycetaceae bacterium]